MDSVKRQRRRAGIRGARSRGARAVDRHAHRRLLRAAPSRAGAGRPLPADPIPQAGLGRQHAHSTAGEHRRPRRRRRGVARAPRCAARSHRGPFHRRVDRSPTGPRPPREGAHAHSAGADAGVVASRRCVLEGRRPGVRGIRKRRPLGRVCHVRGRRKRPRMGSVSSVARGADPGCGFAVDQGCRHLLRQSSCPPLTGVDVRARAGCRHSQTGPIRDRRGDPAAVGGDRRVPPLLAPARRGVHDRRGRPSPADPASRARRSGDVGVPGTDTRSPATEIHPIAGPPTSARHEKRATCRFRPGKKASRASSPSAPGFPDSVEKRAADGIRTHGLLHGKQVRGLRPPSAVTGFTC